MLVLTAQKLLHLFEMALKACMLVLCVAVLARLID